MLPLLSSLMTLLQMKALVRMRQQIDGAEIEEYTVDSSALAPHESKYQVCLCSESSFLLTVIERAG